MLTADLVRTRRRGGHIEVAPLRAAERQRLLMAAEQYVSLANNSAGKTRQEFTRACDSVDTKATDYKLMRGLRKLLLDRCVFELSTGFAPDTLRKVVFSQAAIARRALGDGEAFDREESLNAAARLLDLAADEIGPRLHADLKENHRLLEFSSIAPESLVDVYEMSQMQAVLLRATSVVVRLGCSDPVGFRLFFRRLKFRRLLYTISRDSNGHYRIEIDGPFSLFRTVTKYGLQLAMMVPALNDAGGKWELDADVLWGKERARLQFHAQGDDTSRSAPAEVALPAEVEKLRMAFATLETPWSVDVAQELLDLPGVGICVPDLVFVHDGTGDKVHLEVMGFWSRDAVWRRVELVESGLPHFVIFALSSRLRVSEQVLDESLPGQLYVYKGTMSARAILHRLDGFIARQTTS